MAIILDGKAVQEKRKGELQKEFASLPTSASLLVVQVGDNPQSNGYIGKKKAFGESIGLIVHHHQFPAEVTFDELAKDLANANADKTITGIIVQLPLPPHLDPNLVVELIDPLKDVDGLSGASTKALWEGKPELVPATALGVMKILEAYDIPVKGAHVVIIGKGPLVGKPAIFCFLAQGATVTVCHRETKNLAEETKRADIIVAAAGVRNLITKDHVREGQAIVDVGLTAFEEDGKKRLRGDVDFENVQHIVGAITPVPGGVGPMTILCLFENVLQAYKLQHK